MGDNRQRLDDHWYADDPTPAPGTDLEKGSPRDRILFRVEPDGTWTYSHNDNRYRPCSERFANFWAPLKIINRPSVNAPRDSAAFGPRVVDAIRAAGRGRR